ncbi:MAG: glycoside hydrolase family 3 N-terminal domain-containing protein [Paracoccaceae bacterium]
MSETIDDTAAFVADLMGRMTPAEKIGQLVLYGANEGQATGVGEVPWVDRLIGEAKVGSVFGTKSFATVKRMQEAALSTRLAIPLLFAEDVIHGHRTLFPLPLGLAATWDMGLVEDASAAAAFEAAAEGLHQAYAPMIDVCRDPRWGRVAESPGEDPFLASAYAAAVVRGFQGDDPKASGRVSACLKHFVGYGASFGGRDYDAAEIAPETLHDVYLAPFKAGVEAGAQGVMAGFNALNGTPCHAHRPLIEGWLRGVAGFEGIVVSDFTGIRELSDHGIGGREARTVRALLAGIDLDMISGDFLEVLPGLAETGLDDPESGTKVSAQEIVAAIDAACGRVLAVKHRLGLFDDPYKGAVEEKATTSALLPETRALSRRAAAASMVLLKNEAGVLPLAEDGLDLALIGPLTDDRPNMLGTWAVSGKSEACVTLREGLAASTNTIRLAPGAPVESDPAIVDRLNFVPNTVTPDPRDEATLVAEAVAAAEAAGVAVVVIGEAKEHSGECASRVSVEIPAPQRRLFHAVADTIEGTGKPLVAVVLAGRPLSLGEIAERADAVVYAFFAGTEMGNGLADVLYGRAEPQGRLPVSLPAHSGQAPLHHGAALSGRPWPGQWRKFTTNYIDLASEQPPARGLFPFGAGLSWTEFAYQAPALDADRLAGEGEAVVRVGVTNEGERAGTAVVQLYVHDPVARIQRPDQELKGWQRLALEPGERGEAVFRLSRADLAYTLCDAAGRPERVWDPGAFEIRTGPNARDVQAVRLHWDA